MPWINILEPIQLIILKNFSNSLEISIYIWHLIKILIQLIIQLKTQQWINKSPSLNWISTDLLSLSHVSSNLIGDSTILKGFLWINLKYGEKQKYAKIAHGIFCNTVRMKEDHVTLNNIQSNVLGYHWRLIIYNGCWTSD